MPNINVIPRLSLRLLILNVPRNSRGYCLVRLIPELVKWAEWRAFGHRATATTWITGTKVTGTYVEDFV